MDSAAVPVTRHAIVYPAPPGEAAHDDFIVEVDGRPVFVHRARVSAIPFNQAWPGYQRPLEQTEVAAFVSWDMSGTVEVKVTSRRPFTSVITRPYASGIKTRIDGQSLTMTITRPGQFVVEFDGSSRQALHCFANPPAIVQAVGADVLSFGPGIHDAGVIVARSGQTIHLDGGAVVYGAIVADGVHDLRITGRGILDASRFTREQYNEKQGPYGPICLHNCTHCLVEGITIRDPHVWTVIPVNCSDLEIRNIKLIGLWRYNADGIDLVNCQRVTIRDCFVRAYDDCIVLKGMPGWGPYPAGTLPVEDIIVEGCVLWNDWGRCLELGAETVAPRMRRIVFRDCDLIHTAHVAMDIQHGDRATIEDVLFTDIRVELDDANPPPQFQGSREQAYTGMRASGYLPQLMVIGIAKNVYSNDQALGSVSNVRFHHITVTAPAMPPSSFSGADADHQVRGVDITALVVNGQAVASLAAARIDVGAFADGVDIRR